MNLDKVKRSNLESIIQEEINKSDPIGLISMGAPVDEYIIEARKIVNGFNKIKTIKELEKLLYSTFVEMFDARLAGPKSVYSELSKRINRRLKT